MALVDGNTNTPDISRPQNSMLRAILFVLLGLVLGVFITLGIEYGLMRAGVFETVLQNYFLAASFSSAPVSQINPSQIETPPSIASSTIAVPKAYATQEYTNALNASVSSLDAVVAQSVQVGALFLKIKTQVSSGNLNGTFDLIVSAKALLAQQQISIKEFGQHISELSVANQSTADVSTKSFTADLVAKGIALQPDLLSYNVALGGLLSGTIPTSVQMAAVDAQATNVQAEAKSFVSAANQLFSYFGSASTPAKK